jgi:hypothetical protein
LLSNKDSKDNECARLWLQSNEIMATGMMLGDLLNNYSQCGYEPPPHLSDAMLKIDQCSQQLFWASRQLWMKTGAPFHFRLCEAIKILLGY